MANSNTGTRTQTTYQFDIPHVDVVSMMNDPQVLLEGGDVATDQVFTVILRKSNGTEILLREMKATDTLVFRYSKVEVAQDPATYTGIDIQA